MKPPPTLQSLKDRLASVAKRGDAAADSDGVGIGQVSRAMQEATSVKAVERAGELKARIRAGLERLQHESAGLGATLNARVEALIKPRSVDGAVADRAPADQPDVVGSRAIEGQSVEVDLPTARREPSTATEPVGELSSADGLVGAPPTGRDAEPSLVTRTFGRVGLTAVHARLGAMARARGKQPSADARSGPSADALAEPAIQRIDADLPLLDKGTIAAIGSTAGDGAEKDRMPSIAPAQPPQPRSATQAATRRRRSSGRRRLAVGFGSLLTALVMGGLVHIATTLAMPTLATWFGKGTAYDRLKFKLEPNVMKSFDVEATASQAQLPFLTPDMHYAFCRYDISLGSVSVSATLLDVGWSLALYTPQGDNFYAAPGLEGRASDVSFVIVPASDRLLIIPGVRRADVDAAQVTSPSREGLVVLRAPYKGRAFEAGTRAAMAKATCQPISRR